MLNLLLSFSNFIFISIQIFNLLSRTQFFSFIFLLLYLFFYVFLTLPYFFIVPNFMNEFLFLFCTYILLFYLIFLTFFISILNFYSNFISILFILFLIAKLSLSLASIILSVFYLTPSPTHPGKVFKWN